MDLMSRRSLLMMQAELPSAYKKVAYLQSTGLQYIKTGVFPSGTFGFEVDFMSLSNVSSYQFGCIFGGRKSSGNNDFQLTTFTTDSKKGCLRFGSATANDAGIVKDQRATASFHNLKFVNADGEEKSITSYTWGDPREIYLFLLNTNGTAEQGGTGCRIYDLKFYDGSTLIKHYIPCYRKSDNKPGMYETVAGAFLTNNGSGEFSLPT